MWPERGVPIEPVAIQTPVDCGNADGFGAVALGVGLGATMPGRLGLGSALGVGLGPPASTKSAPPMTSTATTAAAAKAVLNMDRVLHGPEHGPLTGSMDLVQDGIDDPIREDLHPDREVGGEECFGIARRRHAGCSWSRMGVRASASSAARIAAVA